MVRRESKLSPESYTPPADLWEEAATLAMRELNSPRSLTVHSLLRSGNYLELAQLELDPRKYLDRHVFVRDYQATELLRKFSGLPGTTNESRKTLAFGKARAAERVCGETNRRILDWTLGSGFPPNVERAITHARRKIQWVLGEYSLEEHLNHCRWGPGSDALNKRPFVAPYHKFHGKLSATHGVLPFVAALLEGNAPWSRWLAQTESPGVFTPVATVIPGNGALTVPKTALTDRFICVEPGLNVHIQLGLGQVMRKRLKKIAIDLTNQETNRMFALEGSALGNWATIDLSSASDTVARGLVQILFDTPLLRPWLRVMLSIRSPMTNWGTRKKPSWELNRKISSMGNGFTFELETLIFWALSSAVAEQNGGKCATVYGDDIIVSTSVYPQVTEILQECGFTVNRRKSFCEGYFRESCGMDAFDGYEVASYRLEELKTLADVYSFHNGLRRLGLSRSANAVLRKIPASLRFFGPSGAGDVVLHNTDFSTWKAVPHGTADQWFYWAMRMRALKFVPDRDPVRSYEPAILHSLYTMVPLSDHPVYDGGRWGSQGFATLTTGRWEIGEILVSREKLGTPGYSRP